MDKISIRVYEKRNREKIAEAISKNYGKILSQIIYIFYFLNTSIGLKNGQKIRMYLPRDFLITISICLKVLAKEIGMMS